MRDERTAVTAYVHPGTLMTFMNAAARSTAVLPVQPELPKLTPAGDIEADLDVHCRQLGGQVLGHGRHRDALHVVQPSAAVADRADHSIEPWKTAHCPPSSCPAVRYGKAASQSSTASTAYTNIMLRIFLAGSGSAKVRPWTGQPGGMRECQGECRLRAVGRVGRPGRVRECQGECRLRPWGRIATVSGC